MKLIKLDAIDSTNEFLKGLSNKQTLDNFTVVTAEKQSDGKGQMGSVWTSEVGKNLIMSVLIKNFFADVSEVYNLTIVMSLAVIEALETYHIPNLSIKWPNDIMSDKKKIGGILIENSIKSDGSIISIVGLGLNVNQTNFENLPNASSMAVVTNLKFEKEAVLFSILENLERNVSIWNQKQNEFWVNYSNLLFKKGLPMPFAEKNNKNFMGIIQGVSKNGLLSVLLEDDTVAEYDIKEIQLLY